MQIIKKEIRLIIHKMESSLFRKLSFFFQCINTRMPKTGINRNRFKISSCKKEKAARNDTIKLSKIKCGPNLERAADVCPTGTKPAKNFE